MTENEAVIGAHLIQVVNHLSEDAGGMPERILVRRVNDETFAVQIFYAGQKDPRSFYVEGEKQAEGYLASK